MAGPRCLWLTGAGIQRQARMLVTCGGLLGSRCRAALRRSSTLAQAAGNRRIHTRCVASGFICQRAGNRCADALRPRRSASRLAVGRGESFAAASPATAGRTQVGLPTSATPRSSANCVPGQRLGRQEEGDQVVVEKQFQPLTDLPRCEKEAQRRHLALARAYTALVDLRRSAGLLARRGA